MRSRLMFVLLAMVMILGFSFPATSHAASPTAKKLNIAIAQEPETLDMNLTGNTVDSMVLANITEYLMDKKTNGELAPGLATAWKLSPDGKTVEFTLRKGVKFHSGDALTSKDVVFSFERAKAKSYNLKRVLSGIVKVEAPDDYRVNIELKRIDVNFIPLRAVVPIVSKSYYDRVGDDVFTRKPVGTGPYKFVRHSSGEYLDIERFEDYWGKKPQVQAVRFYFVAENTTRIARLQAGEVDMIQGVPFNMVKGVESSPDYKIVKLATQHPNKAIMFSNRNPDKPWYDKRVRLAMAYAIDCDAIIKNILFGIPNHWPWVAPNELGYDPAVKPYPYDPGKAKALLAEAGYPNGFEFTLYWQMSGRVPMAAEIVQAVASFWQAVGIKTKLVGQQQDALQKKRRAGKKPDSDYVAYFSGGLAGFPDPSFPAFLWFSCKGPNSTYCNEDFDKLVKAARKTVDEAKREGLIKQMVKIMRDDVPCIILFNSVSVYGMHKNIDFVPTQKHSIDLVLVKDITVH